MKREKTLGREQLGRLLQLLLALKGGRAPNARELAEQCEVSKRTIYRDLDTLALCGVPVEYRPERQGYRVAPGFVFDVPRIEEREALALVILLNQRGEEDQLGLSSDARSGLRKVVEGLPADARARLSALEEVLDDAPRSPRLLPPNSSILESIVQSLTERRQLRLWYRDASAPGLQTTKLSPYRLLRHASDWWLVGRSSLHREVRGLRLRVIERAVVTDDRYSLPPRFNVQRVFERVAQPDAYCKVDAANLAMQNETCLLSREGA